MWESIGGIGTVLWFLLLVWIALALAFGKRDATDAHNGERSGLILYTDHETGCQYVQGGLLGGITPRLDANGKPMCVRKP